MTSGIDAMPPLLQFLSLVVRVEPLLGWPGLTLVVLLDGTIIVYKPGYMTALDPIEHAGPLGVARMAEFLRVGT
jgi:hypothetical protein